MGPEDPSSNLGLPDGDKVEIKARLSIENEGVDVEKAKAGLLRILSNNKLLAMATVNECKSYINTAFFCFDELLNIFMLNDLSSHHVANIAKNPSVALAIYDSSQGVASKREGLQIFGNCEKAEGELEERGMRLYLGRFPEFEQWLRASGKGIDAAKKMVYVVKPEKIVLYDEPDFGHKLISIKVG